VDQFLVQQNHLLQLEVEVFLLFHQLHLLVVAVVERVVVVYQLLCILEQLVDQEVEDQLLSHHQDLLLVELEIHLQ
jgi:hypothetical protein